MTQPNLNQNFFRDDDGQASFTDNFVGGSALPGVAAVPTEPTPVGSFERHWLHTLAHVLSEEIQELSSAEKQSGAMLPPVTQAATGTILRTLCEKEAAQSVIQRRRLEQVRQMLGQPADGRTSQQIESLVLGLAETIHENNAGVARDLALLDGLRKMRQYEVARYCSARDFAQLLGLNPVAQLLQQSVDELTTSEARLGLLAEILAAQTGLPDFL